MELPHPGEAARAQIMRIHSKKMKVDLEDVNFEELARCTEDFNGAQMKAVAVESGMIALRRSVRERVEFSVCYVTVASMHLHASLVYHAWC